MRALFKVVTIGLAVLILGPASASTAFAGCVDPSTMLRGHADLLLKLLPGTARAFDEVNLAASSSANAAEEDDDPSIVGMWQFVFTSQGNNVAPAFIPDGAPLDSGYSQWHSDQTEIMNSSRDPATSNFCLGVWRATGRRGFKLNHFALSWDNTGHFCTPVAPATSCLVGPANIREEVTLGSRGNSYRGTVTIDQYDNNNHLMFRLHGTVSAARITAD